VKRTTSIAIVLILAAAGCSSSSDSGSAPPTNLNVFAASSLKAAFAELGPAFENDHPNVHVVFNFGPSDGLAGQIQSEGVADVFASASGTWMDAVAEDPGVEDRTDFTHNSLVLVTPSDDPASISSLEDLATPGVQLVLAADGVPVGDYARDALKNAGILQAALQNVVSNEEDAASVVAKITAGEADAAIVYRSDVSSATGNDLRSIAIPDDVNVIATYPIGIVTGSTHATLARQFVELVTGDEGRSVLEEYGFQPVD
jgi:molybdate transport system substrate-binding protein